jgi:trans-2,3-dihydro-3-hydroxyanthranilate isomerase
VFLDARAVSHERMQRLARELSLSETVFLLPAPDERCEARARIFTPQMELPFAGHPVLGSAAVVARALELPAVRLQTGAGAVEVEVEVEAHSSTACFGRMRQPLPTWTEFERAPQLLAALGLERSGLPIEVYGNGPRHVYVQAPDVATVATLAPDRAALAALGAIGVSCFARSAGGYRTRMFAPGLGVDEDPATGSAAGPLAVHLARHGQIEFGEEIEIVQGVEIGRPSRLLARARGSLERLEAVDVAGSSVLVAEGAFGVG